MRSGQVGEIMESTTWRAPWRWRGAILGTALALGLPLAGLAGLISPDAQAAALPPSDEITITNVASLNSKYAALSSHVWGPAGMPQRGADIVEEPPTEIDLPPPPGVRVIRYVIQMPTSLGTWIEVPTYHYIPSTFSKYELVIVNPGHTCSWTDSAYGEPQTIQALLADGYAVLATYMPRQNPIDCWEFSQAHNPLFDPDTGLRPAFGSPLRYFLEPIRRSLNQIEQDFFGYEKYHIVGLSGGGWTATLYAALDGSVSVSIPVAGSLPFYMRNPSDWEQEFDATINSFYGIAAYKDLYVMGSFGLGRRQIQVLNRRDDCCFGEDEYAGGSPPWDQAVRAYETQVRNKVGQLGSGSFRVEINEATDAGLRGHAIHHNALVNVILAELNGAHSFSGTYAQNSFSRRMNGTMWHHNWSSWIDTGVKIVGTPAVLSGSVSGHSYDVFYRNPYNELKHAYRTGSTTWTVSATVFGTVISDPVAVSWAQGRMDVVAIGTDYKLYHWSYVNGAWTIALMHPSALAVGRLALTTWGTNHLDLFFRGHDRTLHHIETSTGGAPYTYTPTGWLMKNFPTSMTQNGHVWSYFVGTNDQLYEAYKPAGGVFRLSGISAASGSTGTQVFGSPSAYRTASVVRVFANILGNHLGVFSYSGGWSLSDKGWGPTNGTGVLGSPTNTWPQGGAFMLQEGRNLVHHNGSSTWSNKGGYVDR